MLKPSFPSLAFVALALLGGCAATVERPAANEARLSAPSVARDKVLVVLVAPKELLAHPDWESLREEWQNSLEEAAVQQRIAAALLASEDKASGPAVLVRVKVNDFRYVSQVKRYAIGVFAGNASMDLDAEFVELPSGQLLGSRKYATSSSFLQGVFSAMTPKQVQAVVAEIVREASGK